jgi:hypothetical protein
MSHIRDLSKKYPPSEPCFCGICLSFCARPGWWTTAEAERALKAGLGGRMMMEIAPDYRFGVLAPAFKGCEGWFAIQEFAPNGCNFLNDQRCELHGTIHKPLECQICHHSRPGLGKRCHADIEKEWRAPQGHHLVMRWARQTDVWKYLDRFGLETFLSDGAFHPRR